MVRGIVTENYSRLKRPGNIMPQDVEEALEQHGLMGEYKNRPAYQRNDYLSWINQAVRPETRQKRLKKMLEELESGGVYMGMKHRSSLKRDLIRCQLPRRSKLFKVRVSCLLLKQELASKIIVFLKISRTNIKR